MKKQTEINNEKSIGGGVKWYKEKIIEMVEQIEDAWILKAIHNFIVGMAKEGD